MSLLTVIGIFCIIFAMYIFFTSYTFQKLRYQRRIKKGFLNEFVTLVKGEYVSSAYFATSHPVISKTEFKSSSTKHKIQFTQCYNVVLFKTEDADWELFFYLVKEGLVYSQIMALRMFPKHTHIKSEGNVEKTYGRLNIFTNNRYLTGILEENETMDYLRWLIRYNDDILYVLPNNLHYKIFLSDPKICPEL